MITFKRPSPFLLEASGSADQEAGSATIGTGPFVMAGPTFAERAARECRLLSWPPAHRPHRRERSYPTVRAAWAEMLRNNIDMLYEVGADALVDARQRTTISTFSVSFATYQYVDRPERSIAKVPLTGIRRALNAAIDRAELVRDGFDGHATMPSSGLVWPQTLGASATDRESRRSIRNAASSAFKNPRRRFTFTCLVPTDYERVALVVQQQLAAVGVDDERRSDDARIAPSRR